MTQLHADVVMIRQHLRDIPNWTVPPGHSFHWYCPGDERNWHNIQKQADRLNDVTPELFARSFGAEERLLKERVLFLSDQDGHAIGTAAAWFDDDYHGQSWGRVHWVAIVPQKQGRGFSKPLVTQICLRLRQLGHERAYLTTNIARVPAISLYLKFGFTPEIRSQGDQHAWTDFENRSGHPLGLELPTVS